MGLTCPADACNTSYGTKTNEYDEHMLDEIKHSDVVLLDAGVEFWILR